MSDSGSDNNSNDIVIPADQAAEFFFMDQDQEMEKYGESTKVPVALSGNILKEEKVEKANKVKQINEFKVRVLDFLSIYVKEMRNEESKNSDVKFDSLKLIKGLLKALQVAHHDSNTILFDRVKTVLISIARGGNKDGIQNEQESKDGKMLMTEVMALVLKPTKDQKMHQAYIDTFISLTKTFSQSKDPKMVKFVCQTYKDLLQKFLGGRGAPAHCLNQQFFTRIFEECNSELGKSLMKPLLRYVLPDVKGERSKSLDSLKESDAGAEPEKEEKNKSNARSNHQRLLAIEIFNSLVKASQKNTELLKTLARHMDLISSTILVVLRTSDTWPQKKVKKTMLALNIFTKLSKTIVMNGDFKAKFSNQVHQNGAKIIKAIEEECEKDKTMSNLKGKIKEIQNIVKA